MADNTVDIWRARVAAAEETLASGGEISFEDALDLAAMPGYAVPILVDAAARVRRLFNRDRVDLCSIINARSGRCPEDCAFCAQSSHHATDAPIYPMKSAGDITAAARAAEEKGAHRFCIVTSGDSLSDEDFGVVLESVRRIREETGLQRCASVGRLDKKRTALLKEAGLNRYHHNIETAASFFPAICTTHTYDDKLSTITNLQEAGIETCVGGILNLGESPRQRIELAFELKRLDPISVPINFLSPRPGTPLENRPPIEPLEAAKYLAIYRLVLPRASIRLAGGRVDTFSEYPELPFNAGANALLIGDLLTTKGPAVRSDLEMLQSLGFDTGKP